MTEPSEDAGELPEVFRLWGLHLSKSGDAFWTLWSNWGHWPNIRVSHYPTVEPPGHTWSVSVHWEDRTLATGFGPTFAEAKRNCAALLSERSREVGRCD